VSPPLGPESKKDKGKSPRAPPESSKNPKGSKKEKKIIEKLEPSDPLESELVDVEQEVGKLVPPRPIYPGIIIGAELAKNLRLYVGDDVNVVAPLGGMSPAGPIPKSKPFRVAGVFYSGLYEVDNKFAYVTIPAAQRFLGLGDEISGIEIRVLKLSDAAPLAAAVRRRLGKSGHKVEDWRQRNVNLFSALKLEKLVMFIVLGFIVLVASFSIVTNLNMVVLEKVREIAALKAMGAANVSLLKVFMYAGLYIGIIGMLIGVLSGVGVCTFLANVGLPLDPEIYYISELPVRMNPIDIGIVALGGVLLSFAATIYPALIAARLRPADGMRRHEV
jgi:lipoprotein-releasing system permease protein